MAWTFEITCGTESIPLVFNKTTQQAYRLEYGARIQAEETTVLEHRPDQAAPLPVFGFDGNRTAFFTLQVGDSLKDETWDNTLDNIAVIKRLVDGQNQTALRYWLCGDVEPCYLDIQPDGATRKTRHQILWGFVDDSRSPYEEIGKYNKIANSVVVALQLTPYGEGEEFCICNVLGGSPGMDQFVDVGGGGEAIAVGLEQNDVLGINQDVFDDTVHYIVGDKSQKVDVTNAGGGVKTTPITLAGGSDPLLGYAWVYIDNLTGTLTVELLTNLGTLASVAVTQANAATVSDMTKADAVGATWYRIVVSGTPSGATTAQLKFSGDTGGDDFSIDALYLAEDETIAPNGWIGSCAVENRGDAGHFDYLDIADIPGDAPALATMKVTVDSTGDEIQNFVIGVGVDGRYPIASQPHWLDNDTVFSTVNFVSVADGARTAGEIHRYVNGGGTTVTASLTWRFTGEAARQMLTTARRAFVIAKSTSTAADVYASSPTFPGVVIESRNRPRTTDWQIVGAGLVQGKFVAPVDAPNLTGTPIFDLTINVDVPAGSTFEIDALYLPFADGGFTFGPLDNPLTAGGEYWLVGGQRPYAVTSAAGKREQIFGTVGTLEPVIANRITFAQFASGVANLNDCYIDDTFTIEVCIIPRTRHLLGVL